MYVTDRGLFICGSNVFVSVSAHALPRPGCDVTMTSRREGQQVESGTLRVTRSRSTSPGEMKGADTHPLDQLRGGP